MIRKIEKTENISRIVELWLKTNISAHDFIDSNYWENNVSYVKDALPSADLYVYEQNGEIVGFIGVIEESYIAGIFVDDQFQHQGIGQSLLDRAINEYRKLTLSVYKKNTKALSFYQKNNFKVLNENIDENTGELEINMVYENIK